MTAVIQAGTPIRQTPDVVSRNIAGESILVPIRGDLASLDCIFSLNAVGEFVWTVLAEPTTVAQIVPAVVQEFDVSSAQAAHDVQAFLAELAEAGLIATGEG